MPDILAVQEEVARNIAATIGLRVSELTKDRRANPPRVEPVAQDAYMRGRYEWNKRQPLSLMRALDFFTEAIDRAPAYAAAYAGLANTYAVLGVAGYDTIPISEAMEKARAAATKAIEIDRDLSDPHASLAFVSHLYDWNWDEAERSSNRPWLSIRITPRRINGTRNS